MTLEPAVLDWRDASHFRPRAGKCVHCDGPTPLRDDAGRPSHKVCAEKEINNRDRR